MRMVMPTLLGVTKDTFKNINSNTMSKLYNTISFQTDGRMAGFSSGFRKPQHNKVVRQELERLQPKQDEVSDIPYTC